MDDSELHGLLSDLPGSPTAKQYRNLARALLPYIQAHVPPMGEGRSLARLQFLIEVARRDLGLARILEGHLDATQILHEAERTAEPGALYGVWASGGPDDTTHFMQSEAIGARDALSGSKPFCSGSDIVDRALVYVYPNEQLVDVDMQAASAEHRLRFERGQWKAQAFSETHTWTVTFDQLPIGPEQKVGEQKWYFERPGFCLGTLAPAACWAGGASGLVDHVRQRTLKGGHAKAHLGAIVAASQSNVAMLEWGATRIDTDPANEQGHMFATALLVRHLIERNCTEVLDRFGRALGPRPFAFDEVNARRTTELQLYIRQCHAESDLEELGTHLAAHPNFP
ncbi:hypothetical protein RE428_15770 [Marinobacter nanhaiticus D15-8W]|uniref:Acyl-CoA dehydrogenase n=1 Tax=Marinobacter nanhaiticus D15-8W TaxID=626887 RepID=N6WWL7_9GAMM|nr:hypothetical protein [Marinobacter nanhaiticus]ENO13198.1 hypothetical protein J057_17420 [Marinobacter nanhaiticus D15-8W]BES70559.1 hypothetical protein RE428_15770 [Marinobacter nanhaiticus D15-8W]